MHRFAAASPSCFPRRIGSAAARILPFLLAAVPLLAQTPEPTPNPLPSIAREARPDQLVSVPGHRSAILGYESGRLEMWAWPLRVLHDFHLSVRVGDEILPADSLARSITVRPESTTLVYAGDTFSIQETLLVPIDSPAALIRLQIQSAQPLEVIAAFQPDLQLEWPGAIGGTDVDWNPRLHAYVMTEAQQRFEALIGSPTATDFVEQYPYGYTGPRETAFSLGVSPKGASTRTIVIAAATSQPKEAEALFQQLGSQFDSALTAAQKFYQDYLRHRVQLTLPDPTLQDAYVWSEVSMIQARVDNPFLGSGLIAGYNVSGDDDRPGFAWFFGRDALWTALALDDIGDLATSRDAIHFLSRYQRADGKIPHEISQSASFVPWFQSIPFAWASADATPLFIIATRDYVQRSGDLQFARDHWDQLWKAHQFLASTDGTDGLAQNLNIGHGWVEAGPLVPVRAELYQSGLGVEADRALAQLAALLHKDDVQQQLTAAVTREQPLLNQLFWLPGQNAFSIALGLDNHPVPIPSVLATVPMDFGLLDADKTESTITRLAAPDFQTDWGMRIISSRESKYDPGGYHNGSVWPLFTGWASMAEYRYHRPLAAYANLRANAALTWSGALGHVAEVLSGDYFQKLAPGSPHQIWSAAMVAAPLLRGLFGLEPNATTQTLTFAPHIPADWTSFAIRNVRVGSSALDLSWSKTSGTIRLDVTRHGNDACTVEFSPALSLLAKVHRVLLNGRPIPFHVDANSYDQHVTMRFSTGNVTDTVAIEVAGDFGVTPTTTLPLPGSASAGTRIVDEQWSPSRDTLTLHIAGPSAAPGELHAWNAGAIASIDGATLAPADSDSAQIRYQMPSAEPNTDAHLDIVIHFRKEAGKNHEP